MSDKTFSEVALTFNRHAADLNRARRVFEDEVRALNALVRRLVQRLCDRPVDQAPAKLRWAAVGDEASAPDVSWLAFRAGTFARLDLRPPGEGGFREAAGHLHFETVFDDEVGRFAFQCRLENRNAIQCELDEAVAARVRVESNRSAFPRSAHVEANNALLFRRELNSKLFASLEQFIDDAARVVREAVDEMFPDAEYRRGPTRVS